MKTIDEIEAAAQAVVDGHPPTEAQRDAAYRTFRACRLAREALNVLQEDYMALQRTLIG